MTIKIFVTGGTFDKEYDEIKGILFFKKTHLSEMLKLGHCKLKFDVTTLMMKDSLNMTDRIGTGFLRAVRKSMKIKLLSHMAQIQCLKRRRFSAGQ